MAIYCENDECKQMISIGPDELDNREQLDSLERGVSEYAYSGYFECPHCGQENYARFVTEEIDSTGEMIACELTNH